MFSRKWLPALLALFCSCSVLEDRMDCPCRLHLDFSDPGNFCNDSLNVHLAADNYSRNVSIRAEQYVEGLFVTIPNRKGVYINVSDGLYDNGGEIRIPAGEQCPETYIFASYCDTSSDEAEEHVRVRKNYCGVTVSFTSAGPDNYLMSVTGKICGYSREGIPIEGVFRFSPSFDDRSVSFFRIPRQTDNSLKLGITSSGGTTRSFALGNYIAESGYDWSKADLDDIVLTIDYAATSIHVTVDDWKKDVPYDVVI